MALNTPPVLTTGPNRTQLPYGLFSVLAPSAGPDRWESGGITWEALTCEPAQALPFECAPSEGREALRFDGSGPNFGEANPFTVNGFFECGTATHSPEDARARAEAHLIAREQTAVEAAFWNGDQQNYPSLTQASPSEGDDEPTYEAPQALGNFGPAAGLAELEQFIASMYGNVGVLHMSRGIALRLFSEGLLHRYQGRIYTELDTPVVAGAGYTDDGTIRATPALIGYRSDIYSFTDELGGFDPQRNDLQGHAGRTYVVGFDPCGVAYVNVSFEE